MNIHGKSPTDDSARPALDQQVTFLYALDAPACWDFYERVMALPLVQDQGRVRIYEVAGGRAFLGVCQAAGPRAGDNPRAEGGVCFTFVTQDVDGWYAFLKGRGALIPKPPQHSVAYRIHHFFLRDPADNLLEIQRFDQPDWPAP